MPPSADMYAPSFLSKNNYYKVRVHSKGKNAKITWLEGPLKGRPATLQVHTLKKKRP